MISSAGHLLFPLMAIVLVNLVLSGDNTVVIALAVRSLPQGQRIRALLAGAAGAVILRVALTFFAGRLLRVEFLITGLRHYDLMDRGQAVPAVCSRKDDGRSTALWLLARHLVHHGC